MNELKPCSHCGSRDLYKIEIKDNLQITQPAIFCNTCKTVLSVEDDSHTFDDDERMKYLEHKVRKAWNHRPAPENKPLTLEQLRQMDGEPVYIVVDGRPDLNAWHMVRRTDVGIIAIGAAAQTIYNYDGKLNFEGGTYYDIEHGNLYGKTWLAYARKPEQEEK